MPTVLIADDSLFQRLTLSKMVKPEGFEILEASNGRQCLEVLRTKTPDMALLDLNMPELSGLDVLKAAQAEGLVTPIVVITADIQDTTRELCRAAGASRILSKPPKDQDVLDAVRALMAVRP